MSAFKFNYFIGCRKLLLCTQLLSCAGLVLTSKKTTSSLCQMTKSMMFHLWRNAMKFYITIMQKMESWSLTTLSIMMVVPPSSSVLRAFSSLARRPVKTTRVFCETSHGKSKSDGLGGVVKSFATRVLCGERHIIRNAEDFTNFFNETLVVKSAIESHYPMLNWMFFLITIEEIDNYRATLPSLKYKFIPGTLSIHK